ncbi:hypothetical protein [Frondihabitans cladoniiphilus]|uniref:Golgi phosphoprotein 3 GPP34 n=1 Tax=Frondihabitans cladoniiphilus TaxID=715785 RepID=A0ABP8VZZ5_9MICO
MLAGNLLTARPTAQPDPVDHLLVDLATGRHLPGDVLHVQQLVHEHGLTEGDAQSAVDTGWELGLLAKDGAASSARVVWTPEASQLHLHRLARHLVVVARSTRPDAPRGIGRPVDLIDGEPGRLTVVEQFGLSVPEDLLLFLDVARALLGRAAPQLLDELAAPIAVLFSEAAQRVHDFEPAAPLEVREEIVRDMVRSLIEREPEAFVDLVADYVVALGIH